MMFEDSSTWKREIIRLVAKTLGVLVHIEGVPHGSSRNINFSRYEGGAASAKP